MAIRQAFLEYHLHPASTGSSSSTGSSVTTPLEALSSIADPILRENGILFEKGGVLEMTATTAPVDTSPTRTPTTTAHRPSDDLHAQEQRAQDLRTSGSVHVRQMAAI